MDNVLLVATMDTKSREVLYLKACLKEAGIPVLVLDAGIKGKSPVPVSINREKVARAGGKTMIEVQGMGHEGKSLEVMINGAIRCAQDLYRQGDISGVISLGGSMGTTLGTGVMRSFPVGFPKVMISTMASRDTREFVGTKDILMLHSVCDISGLNRITNRVLHNGAMAMAGMMQYPPKSLYLGKPLIFISTLGTTEACVQNVRDHLEKGGKEVVVFHTVGAGGKAMEEMLLEEDVRALLDLSLHEITDHIFGGDYDAGPARGSVALQKGVPTILVPGNMDFIVTGPINTAKQRFPNRSYHSHNAAITAVRTARNEMETLAKVIANLCNETRGPCAVFVPMGGFSAFDSKEGPLYDPIAPELFAAALKKALKTESSLHLLPYHINDPEFAAALIQALEKFTGSL
ncbi:MAG TPA: UPF0261 family protein [Desulfobacteraceae bacterium]|nr:UPF0261 family protein [Desulfobacteraceae bacterium]